VTISDLRGRATISVAEAATVLGVGRRVMYAAVRSGQIPSLRIGARRIVVPVPALLAMLGEEPSR
jgi:excisionase family DNA binding protein